MRSPHPSILLSAVALLLATPLLRPAAVSKPLAPASQQQAAALGRSLFFDPALSASGKLSCASCHDPAYAYAPANARAVQLGGPTLRATGVRAVPSLRYTLARTPVWWQPHPSSLVEQLTETDLAPRGGFAWDGRFNTLHDQAAFPILAPNEMAATRPAILQHLRTSPYAAQLRALFGPDALSDPDHAFAVLLSALEAFELTDPTFHPFSSRYDRYLDGKAALTPGELHGLALFNDPKRGNCSSCHISQLGANGAHPLFTDYQFEALGVPRNTEIPANRNPAYFDLGLCGPLRSDVAANRTYCGMFKTPTLRNVATRQTFFHNGRFHSLREALEFYVDRDRHPDRWYKHTHGLADDIPAALSANIDHTTLPLTGRKGDAPIWTAAEIDDVLAFLNTLTDADVAAARP